MTDSILRSYQYYSTTSIVPFPVAPPTFANLLLSGETDGFAIDATNAAQTYGGYVSVIDTITPANNLSNVGLDQSNLVKSGTSAKMVQWGSSPYMRWTPHNMFLNSASPATQSVTVVTGFAYTVTVTGSGSMAGSSGASGTASAGSPVTFTATGTTATWTITGSLTTIQMNRGPIATPYLVTTGSIRIGIPQTYDAAASKYGIWVEPSSTNLCIRSEELSDAAWTASEITVTANNDTSPDGSTTAELLTESANSAAHSVTGTGFSATASVAHTLSAFVKKPGGSTLQWLAVELSETDFGSGVDFYFDLTNNVVGSIVSFGAGWASGSSTITAIGNSWYRITATATNGSDTAARVIFGTTLTDGGSFNHAGSTGRTVNIWGVQVEVGAIASSYIPTPGALAIRAADNNISALTSTLNLGTAYSSWLEAKVLAYGSSGVLLTSIQNTGGAGTDEAELYETTGNDIRMDAVRSSPQADVSSGATQAVGTAFKAGMRVQVNNFNCVAKGTAGTPDTSGAMPIGIDKIVLGRTIAGASYESSLYIYKFVQLPRAMTDGQLQTATT